MPLVLELLSLIEVPARYVARGIAPEARPAVGITDGLIRLSVGLEEAGDLQGDLSQALDLLSRS